MENHPLFIGNMPASTEDDDPKHWVGGDGGPLVVLQSGAAAKWQGALDFDNSQMNGGSAATDYDAVCSAEDYVIQRYDRDMLVLEDSEWSARMFLLPGGIVGVVQVTCIVENLPTVIEHLRTSRPERSLNFSVEDSSLRLLVGADDGAGEIYGFVDVPITPGMKRCDIYAFDEGDVYILAEPDVMAA